MLTQTFFVPVSSQSLAHYFAKAIVLPSSFYENRPPDIQDQFKLEVVLTNERWAGGTDCALQVILLESELQYLAPIDGQSVFFAYHSGIPISRVSAVYFSNRKQSEVTKWNINSGAAYLPTRLIKVDTKGVIEMPALPIASEIKPTEDISEKSKRFDILLGSVAFLNVAKRPPARFSKDYFAVLGYFNTLIRAEFQHAAAEGMATYNDWLTGLYKKENAWSDIMPYITEEVTFEILQDYAAKSNIQVERKFGLIAFDQLPKDNNIYILALLATYGLNKPKGIAELISSFITKLEDERKAEEIAAIFGLHLRYSRLRNSYEQKLPSYAKFRLESKLDYYIIESVFQVAFTGKNAGILDYIDAISPVDQLGRILASNEYRILDVGMTKENSQTEKNITMAQSIQMSPEDDKLLEDLLKAIQMQLQESNVKIISDAVRGFILDRNNQMHAEVTNLRRENSRIKDELVKLKATPPLNEQSRASEASEKKVIPNDGLENMEIAELKKLAKSYNIKPKILNSIKPSKEGIEKLIALIRSNSLFPVNEPTRQD